MSTVPSVKVQEDTYKNIKTNYLFTVTWNIDDAGRETYNGPDSTGDWHLVRRRIIETFNYNQ